MSFVDALNLRSVSLEVRICLGGSDLNFRK